MLNRIFKRGARRNLSVLAGAVVSIVLAPPARATDEIQVYNAGIAAVGQFTIQQHLNYIPLGVKDPPFPGGLVSNHSINGTPEFAYGVTDWWEVGLYLPFAIQNQQFLSDAFKLRTLFVSPNADKRDFFYASIWNSATRRRNSRRPGLRWKCARSSVCVTRTTNSSSTRSSMPALESLVSWTSRRLRAWRESSAQTRI
jgi:hypothetical protein